ncbi:MAG: hypothetical protein GY795_23875 [Desulfobacterales bacterium]|nr:hypothetical protein [Desulfobacterales bacterium]
MKTERITMLILAFIVSLSVAGDFFAQNAFASDDVIIICNKNVCDETLSRKDIKNIFLGRKTEWSNKQKIIFVTLKNKEVHKVFLKEYVGKTPFQYTNYWKKQLFTGKGKPPKSFNTEESLMDYIANTDGAIGYLSSAPEKSKVKIISVQGM